MNNQKYFILSVIFLGRVEILYLWFTSNHDLIILLHFYFSCCMNKAEYFPYALYPVFSTTISEFWTETTRKKFTSCWSLGLDYLVDDDFLADIWYLLSMIIKKMVLLVTVEPIDFYYLKVYDSFVNEKLLFTGKTNNSDYKYVYM